MTLSSTRGRHRAARRPLGQVIVDVAGEGIGRRTAVVAASSGLLVSMAVAPANASVGSDAVALGSADVSALTSQARAQLAAAPAVTVSDGSWAEDIKDVAVVKVTPAPEVRATPAPAQRTVTPVSRSAERTEAPAPKVENNPIPQSVSGSKVLEIASRYVGVPYVYGGTTPRGFDCSGFTSYVYAQLGINLPRSSSAQRHAGKVISRADARPGDLIWTPGHIAIYAGGNSQIDAPRPGKTVQFRKIWQRNPVFIRVS
ncbi:C40 family peptidase [Flavimobilis sp. GY10621]|uniref:C40 family peptidase n=1 Tax=Flavimobilis rhizosphaerae TaxID=2775421 RepID=A0ABR9DM51_9MICO|nr:C40 family peptidase [Flavimobilis rhizosphaerae]MBD9698183.1 C40 family peptidase [Flavimobilis rhizosphaerae]